jgi:sialidase-1
MLDDSAKAISRRQLLQGGTVLAAAAVIGGSSRAVKAAAPAARVIDTRVISRSPEFYHGWPTIVRQRSGRLLLSWSGGREAHICPFGRVDFMTSEDDGRTWTWPRTLLDSAIDDRDSGVLETAKGSIIVTSFTSLAYEPKLTKAEKDGGKGWAPERLEAWRAAHRRLNDEQRKGDLGQWAVRSTDGGRTWSTRLPTVVNSPHGPAQLSDGRLLYAGVELWTEQRRVGVSESVDDGQTWHWLAEIPARKGDDSKQYHELHGVEAADGRLIVHIRNHNKANEGETLQTESTDGGKTWSEPHTIGVWGLPSHLMRLKGGHLLMTYGYRRPPFGNQARLSTDSGRTWSEPMTISDDGAMGDLGYPSTVELADGSLLTVWYEQMKSSPKSVLRQAHWKLG